MQNKELCWQNCATTNMEAAKDAPEFGGTKQTLLRLARGGQF